MSDATINALIVAGTTTITSLIGLAVVWLNLSRKNDETAKQADKKADIIIEKAVEIHTLTNGSLHQVTASLEIANTKIEGLQRLVAEMLDAKQVARDVKAETEVKAATSAADIAVALAKEPFR